MQNLPDALVVILSAAKDLAERPEDAGRLAGVRAFAALI